jgi:transposase
MKQLWNEYIKSDPSGYKYSTYVEHYHKWLSDNKLHQFKENHFRIDFICDDDLSTLNKWRLSTNRNKWEKAVALLDLHNGISITTTSRKIERSTKTIKKWRKRFIESGLESIDLRRTKKVTKETKERLEEKSNKIIKLLHEPPSLHGVNRTSWSLESLSNAYQKLYGESMSRSTVSTYIRAKGYSFKKAKVVLTSTDPEYKIKLKNIRKILSNLKKDEKFFSIDEYGPVAIKIRGGRSYTPKGILQTVPQYQVSKGSLICTAALELSTNQITHFYSQHKNTEEMIKLMLILLDKYSAENKIYFSWDAASWHASKSLHKKVDEVNSSKYRQAHNTPSVELVPLPSCAQFLNVIESVFSGMAKAIIHNSNYKSENECKKAIDWYFEERNKSFIKNPKKAGKRIWGEELVKPIFSESNTCKNPGYR